MRSFVASIVVLLATHMASAEAPATATDFSTASSAFASDLYGKVRSENGNLCLSPFSVSTALAMVAVGARGNTETQMLAILHWTLPANELPLDSAELTRLVAPPADSSKGDTSQPAGRPAAAIVRICSSLWGATGLAYEHSFQRQLRQDFGAQLHVVNFADDAEAARTQINTWASNATNKRIPQALPAGAINRETRLVLVNAVYFKASWAEAFNDRATQNQPFHLDDGTSATVPLMQRQARFNYAENDQFQMIELPYSEGFSMLVLLPKESDRMKELEAKFSAGLWQPMMADPNYQWVNLYLPRFKMNCDYELKHPLAEMGMKDACTRAADFSGISSTDRLRIDAVSHSTFIAVDEKGTEAAAVTSIQMRAATAFHRPETPVIFRADHPFLFAIRHNATGAILFMGRLVDPR